MAEASTAGGAARQEDAPIDGILPGEHWAQAPEDSGHVDSLFEESLRSSTASITSSILDYRTVEGRTYHSERGNALYWGANDADQLDTMDITHHNFTLGLDGKLYLSPLKDENIKNVLDVGTGTGIWAIDFADQHPSASIIGTDISPEQSRWVPPNVRFEIEDCTDDWTFPPSTFDFIHMRFLVGSIDSWDRLLAQAFTACAPGGYVESVEPNPHIQSDDGSVKPTMALGQWGKLFVTGGRKFGRSFELFENNTVRKAMEKAGFVDIVVKDIKMPIGPWDKDPKKKEIGEFTRLAMFKDPEGYILFFASALGWKKEEITVYGAHLRKELMDKSVHSFFTNRFVYGRKPEA
ncbi:S-adenosyl-L-methionine-dependent methyltransferase [Podospora conica]|nr:S-adenosyl-L-methionine-dependent methyltransferase [Schizothecium conicum]